MKSLDQYYTQPLILRDVAKFCIPLMKKHKIKTFVDFSCGTNEFVKNLLDMMPGLRTISYDVCPPEDVHGTVRVQDFLKLKRAPPTTSPVACGLRVLVLFPDCCEVLLLCDRPPSVRKFLPLVACLGCFRKPRSCFCWERKCKCRDH